MNRVAKSIFALAAVFSGGCQLSPVLGEEVLLSRALIEPAPLVGKEAAFLGYIDFDGSDLILYSSEIALKYGVVSETAHLSISLESIVPEKMERCIGKLVSVSGKLGIMEVEENNPNLSYPVAFIESISFINMAEDKKVCFNKRS